MNDCMCGPCTTAKKMESSIEVTRLLTQELEACKAENEGLRRDNKRLTEALHFAQADIEMRDGANRR